MPARVGWRDGLAGNISSVGRRGSEGNNDDYPCEIHVPPLQEKTNRRKSNANHRALKITSAPPTSRQARFTLLGAPLAAASPAAITTTTQTGTQKA